MATYKKVVEMLGENLASFLELAKKLLVDWAIEPKKLLHLFQNIRKDDLTGLIAGTHEIKPKNKLEAKQNLSGRKTFEVEVDGTKTLEQLIADGKYDWKNSDIKEKNFPIKDKTKRAATIELFHFGFDISSENVIKAMNKEGCRPATIEELLALGAKHPELQKEFPIIALGSVWQDWSGDRSVPELPWGASRRELDLFWFDDDWSGYSRFAGVRNNA